MLLIIHLVHFLPVGKQFLDRDVVIDGSPRHIVQAKATDRDEVI